MSKPPEYITKDIINRVYRWHYRFQNGEDSKMRFRERGAGKDAVWCPVDDKTGIKMFASQSMALRSYHINKILFHFGVVPKVYDFVSLDIKLDSGGTKTYYGFRMELCMTYGEVYGNKGFMKEYNSMNRLLNSRMRETPFVASDIWEWNIGITQNCEPIYIDVSEFYVDNHGWEAQQFQEVSDKRYYEGATDFLSDEDEDSSYDGCDCSYCTKGKGYESSPPF